MPVTARRLGQSVETSDRRWPAGRRCAHRFRLRSIGCRNWSQLLQTSGYESTLFSGPGPSWRGEDADRLQDQDAHTGNRWKRSESQRKTRLLVVLVSCMWSPGLVVISRGAERAGCTGAETCSRKIGEQRRRTPSGVGGPAPSRPSGGETGLWWCAGHAGLRSIRGVGVRGNSLPGALRSWGRIEMTPGDGSDGAEHGGVHPNRQVRAVMAQGGWQRRRRRSAALRTRGGVRGRRGDGH